MRSQAPRSVVAAGWILLVIAGLTVVQFARIVLVAVGLSAAAVAIAITSGVLAVGLTLLFARAISRGSRFSVPIAVVMVCWTIYSLFAEVSIPTVLETGLSVVLLVLVLQPEARRFVNETRRNSAREPR